MTTSAATRTTTPDGLSTPRAPSSAPAAARTAQALAAALASHDARTATRHAA